MDNASWKNGGVGNPSVVGGGFYEQVIGGQTSMLGESFH